jgi:mRNA-degrading endonuclease toxin of MazEF toxin-antitoxin module
MKRGDIVILAPPSPFNKPRPCLIVQAEVFAENETVTVALITSDPAYTGGFRVPIRSHAERASQTFRNHDR